jgi:hypothetical protein
MVQVKFSQLLKKLGVNASQTTKKIVDLKSKFDEAWEGYTELLENYEESTDEDEQQEIKESIEEFEELLTDGDAELVSLINAWNKNKEVWQNNARKMAEGRSNKKNNSNLSQTVHHNAANGSELPLFDNSNASNGGEVKKKSGGGFWIIAGFVAVVTLGAVVLKKD